MTTSGFDPIELALWRRVRRDIGRAARRGVVVGRPGRVDIDRAACIAVFIDGARIVGRYRFTPRPSHSLPADIELLSDCELARVPGATIAGVAVNKH